MKDVMQIGAAVNRQAKANKQAAARRRREAALARLVEGKAGDEQPASVRQQLRALERLGLVEYRNGGWFRTEGGAR